MTSGGLIDITGNEITPIIFDDPIYFNYEVARYKIIFVVTKGLFFDVLNIVKLFEFHVTYRLNF
jgi:hypothetical protein